MVSSSRKVNLITFFFFFSLTFPRTDGSINVIGQLLESPDCFYGLFKVFVLHPILRKLDFHFSRYKLLPDDIENFDAFGNLACSSREYLMQNKNCQKHLNYTESFKEITDALEVDHENPIFADFTDYYDRFWPLSSHDFKFIGYKHYSPFEKRPKFNASIREASALQAEDLYRNQRLRSSTNSLPREKFPKTITEFPSLSFPFQVRYAAVFETYLVDLMTIFYPYIDVKSLVKLEDFLGLILFHILVFLDLSNNLYIAFAFQLIQDLKGLDSLLNLSSFKNANDLDLVKGLDNLFTDVLLLNLPMTFEIFLDSKVLNLNSSAVIIRVLTSRRDQLVKLFLSQVDRNCFINPINDNYSGHLCHAIYWLKHKWLFRELLNYRDVDWNAPDCLGYTVLGYLIKDIHFDERLRIFLTSSKHFNLCFCQGESRRNVLEECLQISDARRGLSRFCTFLDVRSKRDDFGELLVSAAVANRIDLFKRILNYRLSRHCHELDQAFQIIFQYMGLDEPYLFEFLQSMILALQDQHGPRGKQLEHLFLMKWQYQLARWTAAVDEMQINI